jgi:hypothetical protein
MIRQPLKDVIAGRGVLARYVLIRSLGERASSAQDFHRGCGTAAVTGARQTRKLGPRP